MLVHFSLTLILCLLNLIHFKESIHKNYVLPLTFLAIGLFMGLRYDYGLDYWNYHHAFYFYSGYSAEEFLFWKFFFLFDKYYQFILVKSLLLAIILFFLVRKYVPVRYYWLFVFFYMVNGSLSYTMMTAERTCVGAMVLWVGLEFFYFRKKRTLLLVGSIFVASLFHTVLLATLIIPIIDFLFNKNLYKKHSMLILFIVAALLLVGATVVSSVFGFITSEIGAFTKYDYYVEGRRFGASNIIGMLLKSLMLFPAYQLIKPIKSMPHGSVYSKFVVLFLCYLLVYFTGLESDGRFGLIFLPFFVIAMTQCLTTMPKGDNLSPLLLILPFLFITTLSAVTTYTRMIENPYLPGNYMTYQTIFQVGFFE